MLYRINIPDFLLVTITAGIIHLSLIYSTDKIHIRTCCRCQRRCSRKIDVYVCIEMFINLFEIVVRRGEHDWACRCSVNYCPLYSQPKPRLASINKYKAMGSRRVRSEVNRGLHQGNIVYLNNKVLGIWSMTSNI